MSDQPQSTAAAEMLPLDLPRVVPITIAGHSYVYKFRRIVASDWVKFSKGIVHEEEIVDGKASVTYDQNAAMTQLVDDAVIDVEGYRVPEGDPIKIALSIAELRARIPAGHKQAVARVLKNVSPTEPVSDEALVLTELAEVSVRALWSAVSGEKTVKAYAGLIHRFKHPSIQNLRSYNREASRSLVVGGSRTGRTIHTNKAELLMKLYDELIVSVDGYSINGVALPEDNAVIKREMDGYHKAVAAQQLFATAFDEAPQQPEEVQA